MEPHIISILPFILLLLSIAILPLINNKWWGNNYHIISIGFGLITLIYYLIIRKGFDIMHSLQE
ncbi:MAG: sodium:proton antiporter, partial [Ignavibacteria bacterium]